MSFVSLVFPVFFVIVFLLYAKSSHKLQNLILLVASYVFYGWWDWRFLGLIVLSSSIDYLAGRMLCSDHDTPDVKKYPPRKMVLLASIASNLAILGTFKYFNFFVETTQILMTALGMEPYGRFMNIVLPVGISFYTFQSMSYTIDVYSGKQRAERNFPDFLLYVSFFPQLVAGPIERAGHLLGQVTHKRVVTYDGVMSGLQLAALGFFKKVVIADNLARMADYIFATPDVGGGLLLLGAYAFAFQIYCDFSGYSDIARGIARTMGFDLCLNFNLPYLAQNPQDFWHRWHISLSQWFRDYVYIPLGGNRRGEKRKIYNLMATMALVGLWHGPSWHYVFWGIYHGVLLAGYDLISRVRGKINPSPDRWTPSLVMSRIVTFHLICFGWILFRVESMGHLTAMFSSAFGLPFFTNINTELLITFAVLVMPLIGLQVYQAKTRLEVWHGWSPRIRTAFFTSLVYLVLVAGPAEQTAFIYFQF